MSGAKIIKALQEAVVGDLARVTIEGETWAKVKDIHADQKEIMRINNSLREALKDARAFIVLAVKHHSKQAMLDKLDAVVK